MNTGQPHTTLNVLIAEVIDSAAAVDPREIAKLLADRIDPAFLPQYFEDLAADRVRHILSERRNRELAALASNNGGSARSAKVANARGWWQRLCDSSVHIGEGRWLRLGDCGSQELGFAAAERRELAAKNIAAAAYYERLQELLAAHGVETVESLPPSAVRGAGS